MGKKWNAVKRKLPFLSYHYFKKDWGARVEAMSEEKLLRSSSLGYEVGEFGHKMYAGVSFIVAGSYLLLGLALKEWHPVSQVATLFARDKFAKYEEMRYSAAWHELFGERGLADVDKNGLEPREVVQAFEHMEKAGFLSMEGKRFVTPRPTRSDLETAASVYVSALPPREREEKESSRALAHSLWWTPYQQLKREYEYKLSFGFMGAAPGTIPEGND